MNELSDDLKQTRLTPPITIGLIATINRENFQEIEKLIEENFRLFHIQFALGTTCEMCQIILKIITEIQNYRLTKPNQIPIGLMYELSGKIVRIGRLRNDRAVSMRKGEKVVLTSNKLYRDCSMREILYVKNFTRYIPLLKLDDLIFIGPKMIQLKIMKILGKNVTCCIQSETERLQSYAEIVLPYFIPEQAPVTQNSTEAAEIEFAIKNEADFIVVPSVTDPNYYQTLVNLLPEGIKSRPLFIASIDLCLLQGNFDLIKRIVKTFDGAWIKVKDDEDFCGIDEIVDMAKASGKPIIMDYPGKGLNEVDCVCFNDHPVEIIDFLPESPEVPDIQLPIRIVKSFEEIIINNILLSSQILNSKIIIVIGDTGETAIRLSKLRPHCPIITVVKCDCLARRLNIWKGIKPIVFSEEISPSLTYEDELKNRCEFGIAFGLKMDWIKQGDLVVLCFKASETQKGIDCCKISEVSSPSYYQLIHT